MTRKTAVTFKVSDKDREYLTTVMREGINTSRLIRAFIRLMKMDKELRDKVMGFYDIID